MASIRPISDLRNHFTEITREAQASKEPIFLTKNGIGSLVVMSMEAYEENYYNSEVYDKLRVADIQAASTEERLAHDTVISDLRAKLSSLECK